MMKKEQIHIYRQFSNLLINNNIWIPCNINVSANIIGIDTKIVCICSFIIKTKKLKK